MYKGKNHSLIIIFVGKGSSEFMFWVQFFSDLILHCGYKHISLSVIQKFLKIVWILKFFMLIYLLSHWLTL